MYDYEYDEVNNEYLLIVDGYIIGRCKKERDAYFWYCKKNGYHYEASTKFDDEK